MFLLLLKLSSSRYIISMDHHCHALYHHHIVIMYLQDYLLYSPTVPASAFWWTGTVHDLMRGNTFDCNTLVPTQHPDHHIRERVLTLYGHASNYKCYMQLASQQHPDHHIRSYKQGFILRRGGGGAQSNSKLSLPPPRLWYELSVSFRFLHPTPHSKS